MARVPEETIERIRNTADIYDVVAQYVDLKKRGRNFFGLCPFHSEKTPSFSVAPDKQIYHCFGCGAGGSAAALQVVHEVTGAFGGDVLDLYLPGVGILCGFADKL